MTPTLWVVVGALVLLSATLYVAGRKSGQRGPGFGTLFRFALERHPWQVTFVGGGLLAIAILTVISLLK